MAVCFLGLIADSLQRNSEHTFDSRKLLLAIKLSDDRPIGAEINLFLFRSLKLSLELLRRKLMSYFLGCDDLIAGGYKTEGELP